MLDEHARAGTPLPGEMVKGRTCAAVSYLAYLAGTTGASITQACNALRRACHVKLDIECLDRIYLNAYVPILQSSGQVVAFMTQYLDLPIPSPALFDKIGQKFRRSVASFAEANGIPWVKLHRS